MSRVSSAGLLVQCISFEFLGRSVSAWGEGLERLQLACSIYKLHITKTPAGPF